MAAHGHAFIGNHSIYKVGGETIRSEAHGMRIGAGGQAGPLSALDGPVEQVRESFLKAVTRAVRTASVRVMLGDATVTTQETFDPAAVQNLFGMVVSSLRQWESDGVNSTSQEDIRRIFAKFHTKVGNYSMTGHFSVQFHVLLYYAPNQRVIDCQKELSQTIDASKSGEEELSRISEVFIAEKLKSMGHEGLDTQELFETLYRDDMLRQTLESQLDRERGRTLRQLEQKKAGLFAELDGLLTETYQTVPVLIDDARLVTGEEGCLCSFDVENVRGQRRRPVPRRVSSDTIAALKDRLDVVRTALERGAA